MGTQIFVNLPVRNLQKSTEFFRKLGFSYDDKYADENCACLIVGENISVMLLTEPFFQTFTNKPVVDAREVTEVLVCISLDSRKKVDDMVKAATDAGGAAPKPPKDYDAMYQHGFEDLDGHLWELIYLKPTL